MNQLNVYISRHLLTYLLLAVGITTFVMMAGNFARVFDLVAQGVSLTPLVLYVLYKVPQLLGYTLPMGLLVSTVMLFNRMSAEQEISALRASGVSLLQMIAPPLLVAIVLSVICVWLQLFVAPPLAHDARSLKRVTAARSPLALLEEGTFTTVFEGFTVKLDEKDGQTIRGVHVVEVDPATQTLIRNITAPTGEVIVNDAEKRLDLILHQATIVSVDENAPDDPTKLRRMFADQITVPFDYGQALNRHALTRRIGDMSLPQLLAQARLRSERGEETSSLFFELHMRAALAMAPFSFLLIGIPFGLQISRRESSTGLVVAIVVAFFYFGSLMFVEMLQDQPHAYPKVLVWIPNLACQLGGLYLIWRKR